jgi:hypothetical protein
LPKGISIKPAIVGGVGGTGQASIFGGNALLRTLAVLHACERRRAPASVDGGGYQARRWSNSKAEVN